MPSPSPNRFGSPDDAPAPERFGSAADMAAPNSKAAATPAKVYYNEAGQPFTLSGSAPPQLPKTPDQGYTGSILPLRRDESGLHLAVPESIAEPARGAVSAGKRALGVGEQGQNPLRPLDPEQLSAVMALGPKAAPISKGSTTAPPVASSGVTPERAALAKEAIDRFKIPLTGPQIGMSPMLKIAESATKNLPLSGAREHELKVRQSFNSAVAKTFGENAKTITPDVMSRAKKRIGGEINRIEDKTEVGFDQPLLNALAQIEANARSGLTDQEYSVVRRLLDNTIQNVTPQGKIAGTTYGNLLHKNSPLDQGASNSAVNIARAAQQIKTALQDALQRSLSGPDLEDYRMARFEYKNMKTVQPLVNKSPTGDISPLLLNGEVTKNFPNRAFDTSDTNPLDKLAKIGQAFLKEPTTSTTSERGYTFAKLGELGAAVAAGDVFGVPATLAGVGGTLAAGRGLSSILRSPGLAQREIAKGSRPVPKGSFLPGIEDLYRTAPGILTADPYGMNQ